MTTIQQDLEVQKEAILQFLETKALENFPNNLADSMRHILSLQGKRLRPVMVLLVAQGFGVPLADAMPSAAAVEIFHNFTLVHDDIMDKAPLRRGKMTVHEKYGTGKAIITGDAMLPHAIGLLIKGDEQQVAKRMKSFLKMVHEVMEGQQYDMDFETKTDVTVEEYMQMIRLKTSVLFGCACEIGAILGNASAEDQKKLYDFGLYSGLAFQIMDDYLDTFGDAAFGKRIGGDILLNKKTFLLINALHHGNAAQKERIQTLFTETNEAVKIQEFQTIFKEIGVAAMALAKMKELHAKSIEAVQATEGLSEASKKKLIELNEIIFHRTT